MLVIFLPAWSVRFTEAWIYSTLFFLCSLAITVHFLKRDPDLIERRLSGGPTAETEPTQKRIQLVATVFVMALFVVAGFDHRFRWSSPVPPLVVAAADAVAVLGFFIIFLAFRANSHAAAVITVTADQAVVSTGPYGLVRHPMYSGACLLFLATPVALNAKWAMLPAVALCGVIVIRLLDEERYLASHLRMYREYCDRVRYRLIPGIW